MVGSGGGVVSLVLSAVVVVAALGEDLCMSVAGVGCESSQDLLSFFSGEDDVHTKKQCMTWGRRLPGSFRDFQLVTTKETALQ